MLHFTYYYAECRYAECRYAECHYVECRYAECRGAPKKLARDKHSSLFCCGFGDEEKRVWKHLHQLNKSRQIAAIENSAGNKGNADLVKQVTSSFLWPVL